MILFILFLIIVLIFIPLSLRKSKEELEEEKKLDERLQDETIYLPETGTRLTLEEAEKGFFIAHDNKLRVKSDEELEKNYSWEQGQVEKIKNFAIESQFEFPTDDVEDKLIEAIGNCSFTSRYSDIHIYYTILIDEALFLTILQVEYETTNGKYISQSTEWHIVGAIHRDKFNLEQFPSRFQKLEIKEVEKALEDFGAESTVEISGEYLIIKLYSHATLDDAKRMIELLKTVTANIG